MAKKILIIEDEMALIKVLEDKLIHAGFTILKALNGKEGFDSAIKNHPDLILLDIIMPVMDGMTFLEKLREDKWGKTAKIILLTNLTDSEKVMKSRAQGVNDYLIKSDWTLNDIVKKVNEVI